LAKEHRKKQEGKVKREIMEWICGNGIRGGLRKRQRTGEREERREERGEACLLVRVMGV